DPGSPENLVVGRPALEEGRAHVVGDVLVLVELVDDDEGATARRKVSVALTADAAEAADQMMAVEVFDLLQRAALLEDLSQVPGDEELRDSHQGAEQGTHHSHDN